MDVNVEREACALNVLPMPAVLFGLADGALEPRGLPFVFAANVDEALARADGVTGQRHAFEQLMRVRVDQHSIFEHQRLRLVGVAYDVFG